MTVENDAMLEEELACQFKIDMRTFTSFDTSTRKSKKFAFYQAADQCLIFALEKGIEKLCLIALKIDAKF